MIEKGTKVTYLQTKSSGSRGMTISAHEGTLLEYSESICRIKTKNGKTIWVNTKAVRPADQRNALTEAVTGNRGIECFL